MKRHWLPSLVLGLLYPVAALVAGQDINWDQRNYHLYSSLSFIGNSFSLDILPSGIQTFGNPLASLSAAFLQRVSEASSPAVATALLALLQGTSPLLLYAIGLLLLERNRFLAFSAALIGSTGAFALSEAGNTMADLTISMLPVGSLCLLLVGDACKQSTRMLFVALAAGLAGAACGLKLTFIFFLPILTLVMVASIIKAWNNQPLICFKHCLKQMMVAAISFSIAGLLFAAPMIYFSTLNTGSPVFPYFNRFFQSPYHKPINWSDTRFKSESLPEVLAAPLYEFSDSYFPPYNPKRGLSTRRSEPVYRDARPIAWAIAAVIMSFLYIRRAIKSIADKLILRERYVYEKSALVLGTLLSYGIFLNATGIGRYSIPIQMLFGFVIVFAMQEFAQIASSLFACKSAENRIAIHDLPLILHGQQEQKKSSKSRGLLLGIILFAAFVFATQLTPSWGRINFAKHWTYLIGSHEISSKQLTNGKIILPNNAPIIMFSKGYSWIRGSLLTENPLYLWDLKQEIEEEMVRGKILRAVTTGSYSNFFILFKAGSTAGADSQADLFLSKVNLLPDYKAEACLEFQNFAGDKFQICNIDIDPLASNPSLK